jgi:hypothetical protein
MDIKPATAAINISVNKQIANIPATFAIMFLNTLVINNFL